MNREEIINNWYEDLVEESDRFGNSSPNVRLVTGYNIQKLKEALCEGDVQ